MRIPRKIKKAAKYVERHVRHSKNGLLVIPYSEYVVKGRYTKWKLKCANKARRELLRSYIEKWRCFYDGVMWY